MTRLFMLCCILFAFMGCTSNPATLSVGQGLSLDCGPAAVATAYAHNTNSIKTLRDGKNLFQYSDASGFRSYNEMIYALRQIHLYRGLAYGKCPPNSIVHIGIHYMYIDYSNRVHDSITGVRPNEGVTGTCFLLGG